MKKQQRDIQFSQSQISKISQRFDSYSEDGCMDIELFKKFMGLLGLGDAEYITNRIFKLITNSNYCTSLQFIQFLDKINNGSFQQKIYLSFQYLSRQQQGKITYQDIQSIITQMSFVWNFLTGQKISTLSSIEYLCQRIGVNQVHSITFNQFKHKYFQNFNWYQFFNAAPYKEIEKQYKSTMRNSSNQFKIDQIQEYMKLIYSEIQILLHSLSRKKYIKQNVFCLISRLQSNDKIENSFQNQINGHPSSKKIGPAYVAGQSFQLRGDQGFNFRQTLPYMSQEDLQRQLAFYQNKKQQENPYLKISERLQQLINISSKIFKGHNIQSARNYRNKQQQIRMGVKNITRPQKKKRKNIIYFGHENWNIMLNIMLGVRRSLKSHYYKIEPNVDFSQEDVHCKYEHQLIYKRNQKSMKQISETFIDYAPKIFFYLRRYFKMDNAQFLKSIGLEDLVGNLLLGNLSTLSDQTSQGKSGSFIYYTYDSKLLIKVVSKQQHHKLRQIVGPYAKYVRNNPQTYLTRIYGLYKMRNKSTQRYLYFIVLQNVFDNQFQIDERYDIKGATYGRQAKISNQQKLYDKNVAMKDLDLINNHNRIFDIQSSKKQKIYRQILADATFLKDHNIIQYSLLIGIHTNNQPIHPSIHSRGILSKNNRQLYFFGVIDMLSDYSTKRVLQNKFYGILNYDASCRDPQQYYQRFKNFIYKYVFSI